MQIVLLRSPWDLVLACSKLSHHRSHPALVTIRDSNCLLNSLIFVLDKIELRARSKMFTKESLEDNRSHQYSKLSNTQNANQRIFNLKTKKTKTLSQQRKRAGNVHKVRSPGHFGDFHQLFWNLF